MAKATQEATTTATTSNPTAPWFQQARAALDEMDRHGGRWMEQLKAQAGESDKVARLVQAQMLEAARATLGLVEEMTARAIDAGAGMARPWGIA